MRSRRVAMVAVPLLVAAIVAAGMASVLTRAAPAAASAAGDKTTTPIKHLVVIFQENVSFDHYFGTYPNALDSSGEPRFVASPDTPTVNGLTDALLFSNPNFANPQRLDRSQA